jgi:hypothetical protein
VRFPRKLVPPLRLAAVMLLLGCGSVRAQSFPDEPLPTTPAAPAATTTPAAPTREEIQAALAKLRLDPNLGQEHRVRKIPRPRSHRRPTRRLGSWGYLIT